MISGTLNARHRDSGIWHEAGERITLHDEDAALLAAEGKFTPDGDAPAKPYAGPQIPARPARKVGNTSED